MKYGRAANDGFALTPITDVRSQCVSLALASQVDNLYTMCLKGETMKAEVAAVADCLRVMRVRMGELSHSLGGPLSEKGISSRRTLTLILPLSSWEIFG